MSQEIIRAALETRVKDWAQANNLPVSYQNAPFDRPAGAYVECFLLPAPTETQSLDMRHREYLGVFQVSVHVPKGTGPKVAEQYAAALDSVFTTFTPIVKSGLSIYITSPMGALQGIPGDTHYTLPVSCNYRADTIT